MNLIPDAVINPLDLRSEGVRLWREHDLISDKVSESDAPVYLVGTFDESVPVREGARDCNHYAEPFTVAPKSFVCLGVFCTWNSVSS